MGMKDKFARMLGKSNRKAISELSARLGLADNVIYYIDPANGSDTTGDGSELEPFATVGHADSLIPLDLGHYSVTLYLMGNFSEEIYLLHYNGAIMLVAADTPVTLSNGLVSVDGSCVYVLAYINFDNSSLGVIPMVEVPDVKVAGCTFSNLSGEDSAIYIESGNVYLSNVTINSTCNIGIEVYLGNVYLAGTTNSATTPVVKEGGLVVNPDGTLA